MKILFSIISLFLNFSNLFCQTLYLSPILETKIALNKIQIAQEFQPNAVFEFDEERLITNKFKPNLIGLSIGLRNKSNRNSLQVGYNYQSTISGGHVYFLRYYNNNGIYQTPYDFYKCSVVKIGTIPIVLTHFLFIKETKKGSKYSIHCSAYFAINYTFKKERVSEFKSRNYFSAPIANSDTITIETYKVYGSGLYKRKISNIFIYGAGLTFDLVYSNRRLFILSIGYQYSNFYKSATVFDIKTNNIKKQFFTQSNGNAIGISLSRQFELYRIKPKN